MERRKLFSTTTPTPRRKLFCSESEVVAAAIPEQVTNRVVVCMDCGYKMETTEEASTIYCPKCGGNRFCVESEMAVVKEEEKEYSNRRKLFSTVDEDRDFQKEFSETSDPFELKLKEFSGKELTTEQFEKEFSSLTTLDDIEYNGLGEKSETGIKLFSDAFLQAKLFSTIRMTISKTLELDPEVFSKAKEECGRVEIIKQLEDEGRLCPKALLLIKKAHNIPLDAENNEWIKDSGICNDLGVEFGGTKRELPDFKKTIDERYPDAPENILDLLKDRGTIKVEGNQVEIIK